MYSKVISSAPVDVSRLYQHLVDWRFARERLQRLDFKWPDPSIQCGALISSAQKLRRKDRQFDFELKAFLANHNGGGNGKITQRSVDDLLNMLIMVSRQWHQLPNSNSYHL